MVRTCAEPTCMRRTMSGAHRRCPEHEVAYLARTGIRRLERAREYRSSNWQHVRQQALARDRRLCTLRVSDNCTGIAETVHITPGLDHRLATVDDCRSACRRCHGAIDAARRRDNTT